MTLYQGPAGNERSIPRHCRQMADNGQLHTCTNENFNLIISITIIWNWNIKLGPAPINDIEIECVHEVQADDL